MSTTGEIFDFLCGIAPLELQMDYDNAGFLVGRKDAAVERVLLSLDITEKVIEEAVELGAKLIVSHHPLIWMPLKALNDDIGGRKVLLMAEKGIAAICMHTNLDIAEGGVNDVLIRLLGAEPEGPLDEDGCGRVGRLPSPVPMEEFLLLCKDRLRTGGLRYVSSGRPVERIAVMGGSGGSSLERAWTMGCDTYVTADVKYDRFLAAKELGINLIDGDHFCTENPVIPVLAEKLSRAFADTEFIVSQKHCQAVSFI